MNKAKTDPPVSKTEFVALTAMMFSIVAFSVDAMLPALPQIATDLGLSDPQFAPLVLMSFLVGMGVATFVAGPLSDATGRRPVVFGGLFIFSLGALLAWQAHTFEGMLVARFLQGVGAAGPRVVCLAIVRDRFVGTEMARIMSFALVLFMIVPALAPMIGALILSVTDWHAIFLVFIAFAFVLILWFGLRQPESLPTEARRPFRTGVLWAALNEIIRHPTSRNSILVQMLLMGALFSVLAMVQPIFAFSFDRAESFPYWFGGLALASSVSSFVNASLVRKVGMRRLVLWALCYQIGATSLTLALFAMNAPGAFWIYLVWQLGVLLQVGLTSANLNSLALEPMGHIAGATSSVIGSVSIVGGAIIAAAVAPLFNGTPVPLFWVTLLLMIACILLLSTMHRKEAAIADGTS